MNLALLTVLVMGVLYLGYRFYAPYIARILGEDDRRKTPAVEINDGLDYCPCSRPVLFSHHFATIAGAGPIVGPTLAAVYGVVPAMLWIVLGGILFGAVHDYVSMYASIRHRGRSIPQITSRYGGKLGFGLFIGFAILALILVNAIFLKLSVQALVSVIPAAFVNFDPGQFAWTSRLVMEDGSFRVGGIATTSVIVISLVAPVMGYFLYVRKVSTKIMLPIALGVAVLSFVVGLYYPVSFTGLDRATVMAIWTGVLAVYTLFAAALPIWLLLEPRDFINSFVLYIGIFGLLVGALVAGLSGATVGGEGTLPLFSVGRGTEILGPIFPLLFITIACGALSGFHSLVASGTTAKGISVESDARRIGYGSMVVESAFAFLVLIAIAVGLGAAGYFGASGIVWPTEPGMQKNPVLGFAMGFGGLLHQALPFIPLPLLIVFGMLMLEGFLITTLDSAVRLNRYLLEEVWMMAFKNPPKWLMSYWFNTLLSVIAMVGLAVSGGVEALWPVFGTANQLLGALTLTVLSLWLITIRKPAWFTVIPALFMIATTLTSLVEMLWKHAGLSGAPANPVLLVADAVLLVFALGVIVVAVVRIFGRGAGKTPEPEPQPAEA